MGEKAAMKMVIHPQSQLKQVMWLPQPPGGRRGFLIFGEFCHLSVGCKLGEQIFVPDPQQVHEPVPPEESELWGDSCAHLLASHTLTPELLPLACQGPGWSFGH